MRAVLIDDEIASREVLENLILRFAPDVNIVGQASNLLNGVDLIRKHKPNVVFLDVQMPNYYGYEINIFFEEIDFQIIFTTAFDEYAVRAFELAALDYLLKPIEIERFQKAISRLRKNDSTLRAKKKIQLFQQNYREEFPSKITLLDKGFHLSVDINEIVAIEVFVDAEVFDHQCTSAMLVLHVVHSFQDIDAQARFFLSLAYHSIK